MCVVVKTATPTETREGRPRTVRPDGVRSDHSGLQPAAGRRSSGGGASGATGRSGGAGHAGVRNRHRTWSTGFLTLSGEDHLPHPAEAGHTWSSCRGGSTRGLHVPQTAGGVLTGTGLQERRGSCMMQVQTYTQPSLQRACLHLS